jgi:hypothetical protein
MSQETKQEKPPIWEIWRSIYSELGTLEAIADALPDSPAGGVLRGYQEHGLAEILPVTERALKEAGLEPDEVVSQKSYHRGYQITTLLIREMGGEKVDRAEYQRDPDEFFAEATTTFREVTPDAT